MLLYNALNVNHQGLVPSARVSRPLRLLNSQLDIEYIVRYQTCVLYRWIPMVKTCVQIKYIHISFLYHLKV